MGRLGLRAVAIRNVAFEDLGFLARVLDDRGWDVAYCEAATEDLTHKTIRDADLVVALGGPIGVGDAKDYPFLTAEMRLIERRLRRGQPTLGICLGAQLMAAALGARVYRGPVKEIGWGEVSLTPQGMRSPLAPLGKGAEVLHWHGDTFDLPEGATRLAFNANYENQAFEYRRDALALQFHAEVGHLELEEWFVGHAAELVSERLSVAELRDASRQRAETAASTANAVFGGWLDGLACVGGSRVRAAV